MEADIDALSFHSCDPEIWDAIGKTPEEIAALCEKYERDNRRQMAKCRRMGLAGKGLEIHAAKSDWQEGQEHAHPS
jgi:hypothetical protein